MEQLVWKIFNLQANTNTVVSCFLKFEMLHGHFPKVAWDVHKGFYIIVNTLKSLVLEILCSKVVKM